VTAITYVNGPVVGVAPGTANSSIAFCPVGSVATGGAFGPDSDAFGFGTDAFTFGMDGAGFFLSAFNGDAVAHNIQARAACARR
jgi:hypothetical protein